MIFREIYCIHTATREYTHPLKLPQADVTACMQLPPSHTHTSIAIFVYVCVYVKSCVYKYTLVYVCYLVCFGFLPLLYCVALLLSSIHPIYMVSIGKSLHFSTSVFNYLLLFKVCLAAVNVLHLFRMKK